MRSQLSVTVLLIVLSCISAEWVTKQLNTPRARTTAAQVGNKVYIAGGEIENLVETDSIEVLNLDTLELEASNLTLNTRRQQFTATVVGSNIYFAGGFYHKPSILLYDYLSSNFTQLPRAPWAVDVKHIEFKNDNRTVYVFAANTLDIYHRDNDTWTTNEEYRAIVTSLYQPGFAFSDGKAYVVGGFNVTSRKLATDAYIFDMATGAITKMSGVVLPQYYPDTSGVSAIVCLTSSSTAIAMCGYNGTYQICNVYNKQTQTWFTTDMTAFNPPSSGIPQCTVTDYHAYFVLTTSNPTAGQGRVMLVPLATMTLTMIPRTDLLGFYYGITSIGTYTFLFARSNVSTDVLIIFDQTATALSSTSIGSQGQYLGSTAILSFFPWGSASCYWASNQYIGCFSAAGMGTTGSTFSGPIAGTTVVNNYLYLYDNSGTYIYITAPNTIYLTGGNLGRVVLGIFDDHVVTTTDIYPVASSGAIGTVGGDFIPTAFGVIDERGSAPFDAHVLSLTPASTVVYPSTIEVLDTVNNTWTEFDVPALATDNVMFGGALDTHLVLVTYNKAYFISTTTNEVDNTTTANIGQQPTGTVLRTHLQLPVYNNKLLTGVANGITMFNETSTTSLQGRSEANPMINQLLIYDNKLFISDVYANQFYFFVLAQNRWDARLLSGRRAFYSIAAVDSKVFILGGRNDASLSTYGVVATDYTFYFEFNTASSSLSQQINITYPRSEITPISTPDAAIFIGGRSAVGGYFDLIEIYTNRTTSTPVEAVVPVDQPGAPVATPPGTIAGAVVGSVVGAVGIGLAVFFILRAKKKKDKRAQRMATIRTTVNLDDAIAKHPMYTPFAEIKFGKMLGSGANGQVFLGRWKSTDVALKVSMSQANEGFIQEVNLMLGLRPHPNVVRIFGFSIHPETQNVILILEFCDGGSLDNILFDDPNDIPISKKLAWIQGIARGVLHLQSNNIVHRDLAARNVLLHRGEAKITDFGMSRVVDEGKKGTTTSDIGPIRWMAPESIANKEYSTKSDVWSFAVIMYEIISRQEPHVAGDPLEIAVKIRDQGATPGIPEDCPEPLAYIMQRCWQKDPQSRATFQEITDYLDKLKL